MSIDDFKDLINHLKFSHKSQHPKLFTECKKLIENNNSQCHCTFLKLSKNIQDLVLICVKKCCSTCMFCQFSDNWLINYVNMLKIHQIKKYMSIEMLTKKFVILNNLLKSHYDKFTSDEIYKILNVDTQHNIVYPENLLKLFLNFDPQQNINNQYIIIKFLNLDKIIKDNELIFFSFVKNVLIHIINNYINSDIINKIFVDHSSKIINNENFIENIIFEGYDEVIMWLIDNYYVKTINSFLNKKISNKVIKYLMKNGKIKNVLRLFSAIYKNAVKKENWYNLLVTPSNIFESIFIFNDNDIIKSIQSHCCSLKITYVSEMDNIGTDIGGISRDFFTNVINEIYSYFEKEDNNSYYLITSLPVEYDIISLIGKLLCMSIFEHEIKLNFKLHPVIALFLIKTYYSDHKSNYPSFNNIQEYLIAFDIEEITNLLKINNFTYDEIIEFFNLEEETDIISVIHKDNFHSIVESYIMNQLYKKYVRINGTILGIGFSKMLNKIATLDKKLLNEINLQAFYDFLVTENKYDIIENDITSLRAVLDVSSEINEVNINYFKSIFLKVLDRLNIMDINKLKKFFKFWFGTHSIESFSDFKPILKIIKIEEHITCFKSSTCFGILYINNFTKLPKKLYEKYIIDAIDASINNQKICEELNLYVQLM